MGAAISLRAREALMRLKMPAPSQDDITIRADELGDISSPAACRHISAPRFAIKRRAAPRSPTYILLLASTPTADDYFRCGALLVLLSFLPRMRGVDDATLLRRKPCNIALVCRAHW